MPLLQLIRKAGYDIMNQSGQVCQFKIRAKGIRETKSRDKIFVRVWRWRNWWRKTDWFREKWAYFEKKNTYILIKFSELRKRKFRKNSFIYDYKMIFSTNSNKLDHLSQRNSWFSLPCTWYSATLASFMAPILAWFLLALFSTKLYCSSFFISNRV